MIKLEKGPKPQILIDNEDKWLIELLGELKAIFGPAKSLTTLITTDSVSLTFPLISVAIKVIL